MFITLLRRHIPQMGDAPHAQSGFDLNVTKRVADAVLAGGMALV